MQKGLCHRGRETHSAQVSWEMEGEEKIAPGEIYKYKANKQTNKQKKKKHIVRKVCIFKACSFIFKRKKTNKQNICMLPTERYL